MRLWTTAGVVDGGTFTKELIGTWETQAGAKIGRHSGVPLPASLNKGQEGFKP